MNRRKFLQGAAAVGGAVAADFSALRNDFPRALNETYLNSAAQHPLGNHTVRGIQNYVEFLHKGPGEGREDFWMEGFSQVKPMFARLINAKPTEIALCPSTTVGENMILNGMDFTNGSNVVTNDLHYTSCLANYIQRRKHGLDVRIVKHRDWQIDIREMERAVNNKTRLIAISLVSSVNGHMEDVKRLSELAHAHGGYLFADIIQGVGATPIDVEAMGIDFASSAMYKWLQGEHGFGFLYIKEALAGSVVKPRTFTGGVQFHYPPWVADRTPKVPDISVRSRSGVAAFECGTPSVITYAAQHESFRYIERIGVPNIRAHARSLTDRLQRELPDLGFTPITPKGTDSPIVTFLCKDTESVRRKIEKAARTGRARISITGPNSALTVGRFGNHIRFAVSVFNNQEDIDTVLDVLS